MTRAYVSPAGSYLMSFDGDVPPPAPDAIEVPSAPHDARQVWDFGGGKWSDAPASVRDYEDAIQAHIDDAARSKLFHDGVTLASYAASTNPQWASEAQAFVAWRDQVWAYAYQELAKVQGGLREQPTVEQIIAELPIFE